MSKIYLISPPIIDDLNSFLVDLEKILSLKTIPVFQLRLKDYELSKVKNIAKRCLDVCSKHDVLFVINDYVDLAIEIGAGGVHVGVDDENIRNIKNKTQDGFVVGASCYDSKHLAIQAVEQGADYISFGAFFDSPTKKSRGKPSPEIIKWADDILNVSIVVIGGINDKNCGILANKGADFLAVISYIWSSKDKIAALKKMQ